MAASGSSLQVGSPIPALTPHAVSVSLPKWADNVDYEEGRPRVTEAMQTGYPRFFIHRDIRKLAQICSDRFGLPEEACMLFPSARTAEGCRDFLHALRQPGEAATSSRTTRFCVKPAAVSLHGFIHGSGQDSEECEVALHVVFFPADKFPIAKSYWQHTGHGISSRLAERCLRLLGSRPVSEEAGSSSSAPGTSEAAADEKASESSSSRVRYGRNKHYSSSRHLDTVVISADHLPTPPLTPPLAGRSPAVQVDRAGDVPVEPETTTYLEERYGRNLSPRNAHLAKIALRRRIAGVLRSRISIPPAASASERSAEHADGGDDPALVTSGFLEPSERGGGHVSEDDVYLFPGGMAAIFQAHQLVSATRRTPGKSVCFGFPYTDTLKILEKWGPGCHFFGHGTAGDCDQLEVLLAHARSTDGEPAIQALFCEFPSNPLLRSPDLSRIRRLADEYNFVVVVDETIGNFVNVEVVPFADIVVSSLTKVFSGDSNVMGGSLVLSPGLPRYQLLKQHLEDLYEDIYFGEDAIYMERNSRDFRPRIAIINRNASLICDYLVTQTLGPSSAVKSVYYPQFGCTRQFYDARLRSKADDSEPGYGGLFSVTFRSLEASEAFFDTLPCHKGPSLGTNFTLACPYTVLAHYGELDWAEDWGVERGLVRVSVGLENQETLLGWFQSALAAACQAHEDRSNEVALEP